MSYKKCMLFLILAILGGYVNESIARSPEESGKESGVAKLRSLATCETLSEDDCPSGVALLLSKNLEEKDDISRCSSFLIDSRTLVTNNHCIPEDVKQGGVSCAGRLTAIFPKTPHFPEEEAECEKLESFSDEEENSSFEERDLPTKRPDYAIIRLSRPVERSYFAVSREGLPGGLRLTAYTFDPVPGHPLKALLRKKTCQSIQQTDLVPSYRDAFSPVASFRGCQIISGNSGSVAVDSKGRVRAVVHATWHLGPLSSEHELIKYEPFSLMTNAACLPLSKAFAPRDARCDEKRPFSIDFKKLYAAWEDFDFDPQFQDFQLTHRSPFQFKKKRLFINDRMVTIPEIVCAHRSALKQSVEAGSKEGPLFLSLPLWGPTKIVTSDYRYKVIPAQITTMFTSVQFDVNQLLSEGTTLAREVRSSFFTYMDHEISVSLCSE